jgi:hypothetical protein
MFFIATKFDRKFNLFPHELSGSALMEEATYADVVEYMDWTTRSSSPYISASFSFAWVLWEAMRRYHRGIKHDIEIAVIDGLAVRSRTVLVADLLRKGSKEE